MNTLIVYTSTYGYSKKCAEAIKDKLEGKVDMVNVASGNIPAISQYDRVIIGGSIYMGQIQKKLKEFCIQNLNELKTKKIGLYICCGLPENFEIQLKNAYPMELSEMASSIECFGGILNTDKMKFHHKILTHLMLKATAKEGKKPPEPLQKNLENFVTSMNSI